MKTPDRNHYVSISNTCRLHAQR